MQRLLHARCAVLAIIALAGCSAREALAQTHGPASPSVEAPASTPPPAPPLAEVLEGDAREDYAAARLLYDDGDYAGALVKFLKAYDASQDPRLLWNAGACEKNLRHYAKAAELVRRYVEAGPPRVTPEATRDARAFLEAVEPLTGRLTITSNVPGAAVYLDGEPVGVTPLAAGLTVDIGSRQVTVKKEAFRDFSTAVPIAGKDDVRVDATLAPVVHEGHVVVRAGRGDVIAIDGSAVGVGTWEGALSSGGHSLRVTAPDMYPYQSDVLVADDQVRTLDVKLEPRAARASGVPAWVWIAGGTVLAAGAAIAAYFVLRPADQQAGPAVGTISPGTVQLPLSQ